MRVFLGGRFILFSLLFLTGCSSSGRIAAENDRLRDEVIQLQDQVRQLQLRNRELEAELKRASMTPQSIPEDIRDVTPHVAEISIGRLSFIGDKDHDGVSDTLTAYIQPVDGLGRFVQLVGTVSITAAILPVNADAVTIGRATFTPAHVRDAYRSALTGTHYAFEVPVKIPGGFNSAANPDTVTIRVQYSDGLTGETLSADRSINMK